MSADRWYIVSVRGHNCLVEANNRAQAHRRASEFYGNARPATVTEAMELMKAGADVIHAPAAPEQLDLEEAARADEGKAGSAPAPGTTTTGAGSLMRTPHMELKAEGPMNPYSPPASGVALGVGPLMPDNPTITQVDTPAGPVPVVTQRQPRKASEVFGAGFEKKSAADRID